MDKNDLRRGACRIQYLIFKDSSRQFLDKVGFSKKTRLVIFEDVDGKRLYFELLLNNKYDDTASFNIKVVTTTEIEKALLKALKKVYKHYVKAGSIKPKSKK